MKKTITNTVINVFRFRFYGLAWWYNKYFGKCVSIQYWWYKKDYNKYYDKCVRFQKSIYHSIYHSIFQKCADRTERDQLTVCFDSKLVRLEGINSFICATIQQTNLLEQLFLQQWILLLLFVEYNPLFL